ncbi:MAG: Crp/Fnr family transcriptional regulator [Chthonomonas sp.]
MDDLFALRQLHLFRSLSERALREIASACVRRRFAAGEALVTEGAPGSHLLILLKGKAEVVRADENHNEVLLATRGKGDVIGEMALFDGGARSATVRAKGKVEALTLSRDALVFLIRRNPDLALDMLGNLSERLRQADAARLDRSPVRTRLLAHLRALTIEGPGGTQVVRGVRREEMGAAIQASRETVCRELTVLEQEGVLTRKGRAIVFGLQSGEDGLDPDPEP